MPFRCVLLYLDIILVHCKPEHTDDQLMILLKNGSEEAFSILFERYRKRLFMEALYALHDEQSALDVVQDTFQLVWEKRESIFIKVNLLSWLIAAVRYKCIHKQREKSKEQMFCQNYSLITETAIAAIPSLEQNELNQQIRAAITSISSTRSRDAFQKMYIEKKSQKEIASEMGLQVQSVKNLISHALKILRKKLQNNF